LTWAIVSLLFCSVIVVGHEQKVETVLLSKWAPTSILSEAAEFLSEVDPDLYWRFVDNVLAQQEILPIPSNATAEHEANLAKISAFNLLSPSNLRLMEWALTSRAYSPRVVMLQRMPAVNLPECDSFVYFGGEKGSCDLESVRRIVESGANPSSELPLITDADHKHPSFVWSQESQVVAILYGSLTSPNTKAFHDYLKSKTSKIGYILRPHAAGKKTEEKMPLAGYGVELQFKSTEYKAEDDSAKSKDGKQEVSGFVFDKLNEIHPELSEKLEKFQSYLEVAARGKKSEFQALKAWQVQELGLQASHFVTSQDDFIDALLDVSGNFSIQSFIPQLHPRSE